ncbi:hypothetical protein FRC01_003315 [Tulasnella sp. 417]|nr:hypothetical protein FRC01_003315 [Tulasnella sp. 417]
MQPILHQKPFSARLGAGMVPTLPLSPPLQQPQPPVPLGVARLGPPQAMGREFPQALELLIALANQNLRLMAAVEQQRLERQEQRQDMGAGMELGTGAQADWRIERSAPPAPAIMNTDEGLGLQTSAGHLDPLLPRRLSPTAHAPIPACSAPQPHRPTSPPPPQIHLRLTALNPNARRSRTRSRLPRHRYFDSTVFKARISTPKLRRPFKILLSTVSRRDSGEGSSTRGPPTHSGTLIDTRPSTALSNYEADDDEERKRERPHSWLAEVRGWEELVLGDLAEKAEGQHVSSSSAARAIAGMGEFNSPDLFSTSTTAAETSISGFTRKNTFDEGRRWRRLPFLDHSLDRGN